MATFVACCHFACKVPWSCCCSTAVQCELHFRLCEPCYGHSHSWIVGSCTKPCTHAQTCHLDCALHCRMLYGFSRDQAVPFWWVWQKVDDHGVPIHAGVHQLQAYEHWVCSIFMFYCLYPHVSVPVATCLIACTHMYYSLYPYVLLLVPTCITAGDNMCHCLHPHAHLASSAFPSLSSKADR